MGVKNPRCPARYGTFPCILVAGHKSLHQMKGGATFATPSLKATPEARRPAEAAGAEESEEDSVEAPGARSRP